MVNKAINNFVNKKQRGLKGKIMSLVSRFILDVVDDGKKMQEVKGTMFADETKDELEHFQNYGFTSNAPEGSEGIAISLNGNRDHTVIICIDNRQFRFKILASGETCFYSKFGQTIIHKADGSTEYTASKHVFKGPIETDSTIDAEGDITSETDVVSPNTSLEGTRTVFNTHDHPGDSGGTTGQPNQGI